ncbi:hypothetical protein Psta_1394 [Pirellula staleyi DSM 6068]|uniref:Uncharacterized protein n=1 Tax=Pirellula staleyi (strain ATCC 27377 / DSM 6068 / ICPB 4128) TaxID=530564 RepID=D2QWW6_PIRSD|nr:hypothetical protein [Pirellula staleyi]ADB16070.1 hypothetical protein Psta_1394 [Pirellula staleyi DSM 6068]
MKIYAVERPEIVPLEMPSRFRLEIVYFMTPPGQDRAPATLPPDEYFIDKTEAAKWLDDLVVPVVSPLDARAKAEIELTDYHEEFLEWLVTREIERVRVEM